MKLIQIRNNYNALPSGVKVVHAGIEYPQSIPIVEKQKINNTISSTAMRSINLFGQTFKINEPDILEFDNIYETFSSNIASIARDDVFITVAIED